jgi:hypothetical protein
LLLLLLQLIIDLYMLHLLARYIDSHCAAGFTYMGYFFLLTNQVALVARLPNIQVIMSAVTFLIGL